MALLLYLYRDYTGPRVSLALWIPFLWILIIGSRSPSNWLGLSAGVSQSVRYSEGTPLDAAIFGLLIVAGLAVLNHRARGIAAFFKANAALLLFNAYCVTSVLWSDEPYITGKHVVKAIGDLVMVLVVLTDRNPVQAMRRLFSRAGVLLLIGSLVLIYCFPAMGSSFDSDTHRRYFYGVTTQKNELGVISMVFGLAALWTMLSVLGERKTRRRSKKLIANILLLLTAIYLLVLCNSITSLTCLVLSSGVMLTIKGRWIQKKPSLIHWVMGGVLGMALSAVFLDDSGLLLRMLGRNPTLTGRTEIWKAVLSFDVNPWIGVGYDSFWLGDRIQTVARRLGYAGITEAHNGYPRDFYHMGWVGVALVSWTLISGYQRSLRLLRQGAEEGWLSLALVTVTVIFNISEAGIKNQSMIWFCFMLATIEIPLRSMKKGLGTGREFNLLTTKHPTTLRTLHLS